MKEGSSDDCFYRLSFSMLKNYVFLAVWKVNTIQVRPIVRFSWESIEKRLVDLVRLLFSELICFFESRLSLPRSFLSWGLESFWLAGGTRWQLCVSTTHGHWLIDLQARKLLVVAGCLPLISGGDNWEAESLSSGQKSTFKSRVTIMLRLSFR